MTQKTDLRAHYSHQRKSLIPARKSEAARAALSLAEKKGNILSFASQGSEINLWPLNQLLLQQKRLFLPRAEGNSLKIYKIKDLRELTLSSLNVFEPNPDRCEEVSVDQVGLILVPGLAFDVLRFRLGYGKGYYDRLLNAQKVQSIGIGFIEQKIDQELPRDSWDVPLTSLLLF